MAVERAWSSEDGRVLLYLSRISGEDIAYLNNNGDIRTIFKQGVDMARALSSIHNEFQRKKIDLLEVPIYSRNAEIRIHTVQSGRERVFQVRVQNTLMNLGGDPHGIEQLVIATHMIHGNRIEPRQEHSAMILQNGNKLIGLIQAWETTAEIIE